MYKHKGIIQGICPKKYNKRVQIAITLLGIALINTPAFAKKDVSKSVIQINQMLGNGKEGNCIGEIASPSKLTLPLGKSTLINLPEPLASRTVGNPAMLQARLISPLTLYVVGLDIGTTNMIIQGKSGTCSLIDVIVTMDEQGLQETLNQLLVNENNQIKVIASADSLVLKGKVEDAVIANRAVEIAESFVRRQAAQLSKTAQSGDSMGSQGATAGSLQQGQSAQNAASKSPMVVNLLEVGAPQQVMLEVKVAEVSISLLDQLGAEGNLGGDKFRLLTPFFATSTAILGLPIGSALANTFAQGTKFATIPRGPSIGSTTGKGISVDAQKQDGLVKILAEPTIMAISGQEGSFLAGGKIFIPVSQNNSNGAPTITLEEKEFGVGVKFTPTVLSGGRINLRVTPEVSELDKNGIGISATGFSGTAILPSFTTRRASTTVQLLDGQSFAIGGLIKNNTTTNVKAFPILGEIPILGALFRSTEFQKDKTELIFVVTPHLVKPLATNTYHLPTDRYVDPTRSELFLNGKMEGTLPPNAPPAVPNENKAIENKDSALKPNEPAPNTGFDVR